MRHYWDQIPGVSDLKSCFITSSADQGAKTHWPSHPPAREGRASAGCIGGVREPGRLGDVGAPILGQWARQDVAVNQEGEGFLWASHPKHSRNEENSVNSPKAPRPLSLSRETESATWPPAMADSASAAPTPGSGPGDPPTVYCAVLSWL